MKPKKLESLFIISTHLGQSWVVDLFYPTYGVMLEGHHLLANLILLNMANFEEILGIDWLSNHHATLVCREKVVQFFFPKILGSIPEKISKMPPHVLFCFFRLVE